MLGKRETHIKHVYINLKYICKPNWTLQQYTVVWNASVEDSCQSAMPLFTDTPFRILFKIPYHSFITVNQHYVAIEHVPSSLGIGVRDGVGTSFLLTPSTSGCFYTSEKRGLPQLPLPFSFV